MLDVDSWESGRKNGDEHYVDVDIVPKRPAQTNGRQFFNGQSTLEFKVSNSGTLPELFCRTGSSISRYLVIIELYRTSTH